LIETEIDVKEMESARLLAARYQFQFVDLRDSRPDAALLRTIPLELMLHYEFLPLEGDDHRLVIVVADPTNLTRLDELEVKLERNLVVRVAAASQVRDFLKKTEPSQRVLDDATEEFRLDVIREEEIAGEGLSLEHLVEDNDVSPMIRLVDSIIFAGLERRASDIHIESRDNSVVVKYRIDGVLQQAMAPLAREFQSNLITRIKVMSELDIAERRVPQDGRFRVRYRGRLIDFRVSIMFEVGEASGKREMPRQLDKANQITTLTAAVAVEEIFAGVYIERRSGFRVEWAEADELGAVTLVPASPILLPQIIQQRQALFEFFEVFAHGAVLPLETSVGEGKQHSQARMVGEREILRGAAARGPAGPELVPTSARRQARLDRPASANERRGRAFGAERNEPVGWGRGRGPSGGAWRDRAGDSGL
jgi:hypothetical protein